MQAIETSIILDTPPAVEHLEGTARAWLDRAASTGYAGVFFEIDERLDAKRVREIATTVRSVDHVVTTFTRVTVGLEQRHGIKQDLQGIRGTLGVTVLAVASASTEVLNFVARDGRVDIITLESPEQAACFNDGIASLASQAGTFIELPFKPLLATRGPSRSRLLRSYGKVVDTCLDNHARLLFSACATSPVDVKTPAQKMAVLSLLLDVSKQEAREIVVHNAAELANPGRRPGSQVSVTELDVESGDA